MYQGVSTVAGACSHLLLPRLSEAGKSDDKDRKTGEDVAGLGKQLESLQSDLSKAADAVMLFVTNEFHEPPLILCARHGFPAAARGLVAAGVDRTETEGAGNTAMMVAWRRQDMDVVEALNRFAGSDSERQVGAIVIDAGTGEVKLLAMLQLARRVHVIELASSKKLPLVDISKRVAKGEEGDLDELCSALEDGLQKLPDKAGVELAAIEFKCALLGSTAWYRQLGSAMRTRADCMLGEQRGEG